MGVDLTGQRRRENNPGITRGFVPAIPKGRYSQTMSHRARGSSFSIFFRFLERLGPNRPLSPADAADGSLRSKARAIRDWLIANPKVVDGVSITGGAIAALLAIRWFG